MSVTVSVVWRSDPWGQPAERAYVVGPMEFAALPRMDEVVTLFHPDEDVQGQCVVISVEHYARTIPITEMPAVRIVVCPLHKVRMALETEGKS